MVPVLVDERVGELGGLAGGDHDPRSRARAAVARGCTRAAGGAQLVCRDDADRHALDLVAVGGGAKQVGVPLDVDVGRADVERLAALLVDAAR